MKHFILISMFLSIIFIIPKTTLSDEQSYQKFLQLREQVYKSWQSGHYGKLLRRFDADERRQKYLAALGKLKRFIKDKSKFTKEEQRKIEQLMKLDRDTNYSYKRIGVGIKGGFYHTPFGARISTRCFDQLTRASKERMETSSQEEDLSPAEQSIQEDKAETRFYARNTNPYAVEYTINRLFGDSIERMTKCSENYPTLKEHINRWLRTVKKMDFHCIDSTSSELGLNSGYLKDRKVIVFPRDKFAQAVTSPLSDTIIPRQMTIVHELLHAANINNHENHNSHVGRDKKDITCDQTDNTSDMVYLMTHLCLGKKTLKIDTVNGQSFKGKLSVDEQMAIKIKKCGLKRACLDPHKHEENRATFCEEMRDMGDCKLNLPTQEMNALQKRSFQELKSQLRPFFQACGRLIEAAKNIDVAVKTNKTQEEVMAACPSAKYFARQENKTIRTLYDERELEHFFKLSVLETDNFNYLKNHPRFSKYLKTEQWKSLKSFVDAESDETKTKICRKELDLGLSIFDTGVPSSKTEACKTNNLFE